MAFSGSADSVEEDSDGESQETRLPRLPWRTMGAEGASGEVEPALSPWATTARTRPSGITGSEAEEDLVEPPRSPPLLRPPRIPRNTTNRVPSKDCRLAEGGEDNHHCSRSSDCHLRRDTLSAGFNVGRFILL
ncbi:hypothetical protein PO909_033956 [Leuciscus waleckii]